MFGQKAVLQATFNSQHNYSTEEALNAFNEDPFLNFADFEANRNESNVMVKENIEKAQAKQKNSLTERILGRVLCSWCISPKGRLRLEAKVWQYTRLQVVGPVPISTAEWAPVY